MRSASNRCTHRGGNHVVRLALWVPLCPGITDGFFRHQLHAARSTATPTLEDCDRAMADLKAQLADWQATRDELVKDQEAAAQAAAMDQSRQTALDQAKKDLAAAQARLDAIEMGK